MDLDNVLIQRLSKQTQWLQVGYTGSVDRVTIDGAVFVNPPVLADAEPYITAGSTVLVAKLDSGFVILGRINPTMTGPPAPTTTAWTNLTLTNGWGYFGAPFFTPRYRKVGDEVQLRGLLSGFGTLSPATLPAGFRPTAGMYMGITLMSPETATRIDIGTDGVLIPRTAVPGGGWLSLDSLRFSTS